MRPTSLIIATALTTAFCIMPAAPASAIPATTPCAAGAPVPGDYDGDGGADLMVGVESTAAAAPTKQTRLVTPSDGSAPYWAPVPSSNDVVHNADLNGDVCADVVSVVNTGGYNQPTTIFGSTTGLDASTVAHLGLPQGPHPPGVTYGWPEIEAIGIRHHGISQVVVSGVMTIDGDGERPFLDTYTLDAAGRLAGTPVVTELDVLGAADLVALTGSGATVAIGAPNMYVGGKAFVGGKRAGGVLMFSANANDPTTLRYRTTITQDSPGVPGAAESSDYFGSTVSLIDGRLAIGVPGESIGRAKRTGLVQPILWHEGSSTYTVYRSIQQSTRGVPGINESGDWFGSPVLVTRGLTAAGSYDIAIGAPSENVGRTDSAGSVTIANFTKAIYRSYTKSTKGIPGTPRKADRFGVSLGALRSSKTTDTLLIGAPYELQNAERGYVVRSDGRKLASSTKWVGLNPPAAAGVTYTHWGLGFAG